MFYLKLPFGTTELTDSGINTPDPNKLVITFKAINGVGVKEIKAAFSNLDSIVIYGEDAQGEEFLSSEYEKHTTLKEISYDINEDTYTVTMIVTADLEQRVSELEDAVNFLLMGGNE